MERYRLLPSTWPELVGQCLGLKGLGLRLRLALILLKIAPLIQRLAVNWVALPEIDENSRWNGSFDHLVSLIPVGNDQRNFLSTPAT